MSSGPNQERRATIPASIGGKAAAVSLDPRPSALEAYIELTTKKAARRAVVPTLPTPPLAQDKGWIKVKKCCRLMISNLEQLTQASAVRNAIQLAGYHQIKVCEIVLNPDTGASAGIAHVQLNEESHSSSVAAQRLTEDAGNGKIVINGHPVAAALDPEGLLVEERLRELMEQSRKSEHELSLQRQVEQEKISASLEKARKQHLEKERQAVVCRDAQQFRESCKMDSSIAQTIRPGQNHDSPGSTLHRSAPKPVMDYYDRSLSESSYRWRDRVLGGSPYLFMPYRYTNDPTRDIYKCISRFYADQQTKKLTSDSLGYYLLCRSIEDAEKFYQMSLNHAVDGIKLQFQLRWGPRFREADDLSSDSTSDGASESEEDELDLNQLVCESIERDMLPVKSYLKTLLEEEFCRHEQEYATKQAETVVASAPIKTDALTFTIRKRGRISMDSPQHDRGASESQQEMPGLVLKGLNEDNAEGIEAKKDQNARFCQFEETSLEAGIDAVAQQSIDQGSPQNSVDAEPQQSAGQQNQGVSTDAVTGQTISLESYTDGDVRPELYSASQDEAEDAQSHADSEQADEFKEELDPRSSQETSGSDDEHMSDESGTERSGYESEATGSLKEMSSDSESHSGFESRAALLLHALESKTDNEPRYPSRRVIRKYADLDRFFTREARLSLRQSPIERALINTRWMFDDDIPVMSRLDYEQLAEKIFDDKQDLNGKVRDVGENSSMKNEYGGDVINLIEARQELASNSPMPAIPHPLGYDSQDFMSLDEMFSLLAPEDFENLKGMVARNNIIGPLHQKKDEVDVGFWREVLQQQKLAAHPPTNVEQEITPNDLLSYSITSEAQLPWVLRGITAVNQEECRRMPPQRLGHVSGWRQRQSITSLFGAHATVFSEYNEGPPGFIPTAAPQACIEFSQDLETADPVKLATKSLFFARSPIHSWGLFAGQPIQKGEFIIEYVGEIKPLRVTEYQNTRFVQEGTESNYMFALDNQIFLDATRRGSISRLVNHCCTPNCIARPSNIGGTKRIAIYAQKNIRPFEELTYDYKFERESGEARVKCLCGSSKCRGLLA